MAARCFRGALWVGLAAVAGCTEPASGVGVAGTPVLRPAGEPALPESSSPPAYRLERIGPAGRPEAVAGAERVLAAAALADGAVVFVTHEGLDGRLVLVRGAERRTLDEAVVPELAVAPGGRRLLYPRRAGDDVELVLLEPATGARRVVHRGPTADRPCFRPDGGAFAFVGTGDGGLASLFVAEGAGPARQTTNVGLRGPGLPDGFVPPPLRAEDVAWDGGRIAYPLPDGRRCEVDPAAGRGACAEVRP
mgnify:CR=1 FL=1